MKYRLLNPVNPDYSTIETILTNRGIALEDIPHYLNTTDEDISSFLNLGEPQLRAAFEVIKNAIENHEKALLIVDSDCDGYTSAALFTNYFYEHVPEWITDYVTFYMHKGKEHGLAGVEIPEDVKLVIVPDAGSNDYAEHRALADRGISVVVLDHHEAEDGYSEYAIVINNQLADTYCNKELSGVGVTWQFCRYVDSRMNTNYADNYIDLVALGLDADMMSLRSIETKHLIEKGLKNVSNPFFYEMAKKNDFSLGGKLTPIGVAFYIAPFVNSMVRSGTQEEKMLLFNSMLKHRAFELLPSTKRGHKLGEKERLVDQAVRTATNVKSRQTKAQTAGLETFEKMIVDRKLLDNKVLLILVEPGQVPKSIAGLIANKFQAKYQRNTAILTRMTAPDGSVIWQGSARGSSKSEIESFKDLCLQTGVVEYAQGHAGAFGLGIKDENLNAFIEKSNALLAGDSGESLYYVDYEFEGQNVSGQNILDIAQYDFLWGQDIPEAFVAVKGLKINAGMITLMSPDKRPTIKIRTTHGIDIMKFRASQEEYENLFSQNGYVEINLVGKCNRNVWNDNVTPQIIMEDYDIVDRADWMF